MNRRKYVIVGPGARATMYLKAILQDYRQYAELVRLCDISPIRMGWFNRLAVDKYHRPPIAAYPAGDFDRMIRER